MPSLDSKLATLLQDLTGLLRATRRGRFDHAVGHDHESGNERPAADEVKVTFSAIIDGFENAPACLANAAIRSMQQLLVWFSPETLGQPLTAALYALDDDGVIGEKAKTAATQLDTNLPRVTETETTEQVAAAPPAPSFQPVAQAETVTQSPSQGAQPPAQRLDPPAEGPEPNDTSVPEFDSDEFHSDVTRERASHEEPASVGTSE